MQRGARQVVAQQKHKKKVEIGAKVVFYSTAVWGGRIYDTATVKNAEFDEDLSVWCYYMDGGKFTTQRQILKVLK